MYRGGELNTGEISGVDSGECQRLCNLTQGCHYYSYHQATHTCWLKSRMGEAEQEGRGFILGHRRSPAVQDCIYTWSQWNPCSTTCGKGTTVQLINIIKPPSPGGRPCPARKTRPCNLGPCPVDCSYEWSLWSVCSEECGQGTINRYAIITAPPQHGGELCPGIQTSACFQGRESLESYLELYRGST